MKLLYHATTFSTMPSDVDPVDGIDGSVKLGQERDPDLDERYRLPLSSLETRLKSPLCGSRKVAVMFDVPSEPAAARIAGMPSG